MRDLISELGFDAASHIGGGGVVEGGVKGDRNETFPKKAFTLLRLHRLTRQSCFGEAPCNEKHVYSGRT